jgi:uncharacterized phage protein gp47/JayE
MATVDETEGYIYPRVKVDPDELVGSINDAIIENLPGWNPAPYSPESRMIAGLVGDFAVGLQLVTDVPRSVIARYGELANILRDEALPAVGTVTVRAADDQGYTLSDGAPMQGDTADGDSIALELVGPAVIPPGSTFVSGVPVQVQVDGEVGNGITGELRPDETQLWIDSIVLDGPTSRGVDQEDEDDYLDKVARRFPLLADAQISPTNIAALVRDLPGVGRVCVLNLVDPANPSVQTAGHITICPITEQGAAVGNAVRDLVVALTGQTRILNHVFHVVDPTLNDVALKITVARWPEATDADVKAAVEQQIRFWLDGANWGLPQSGDNVQWRQTRHVRLADLTYWARRADGVAYVDLGSPRINNAASDLEMAGLVPLPRVTSVNVTVVERVE